MKLRSFQAVLALGVVFTATATALASEEPLVPRLVPPKGAYVIAQDAIEIPRIIIKFHEGTHVRLRDEKLRQLIDEQSPRERSTLRKLGLTHAQIVNDLQSAMKLIHAHPRVQELQRLFSAPEQYLWTQRTLGEKRSGKELADLDLYVEVVLLPATKSAEVRSLVAELDALFSVETAYAEPSASPAALDLAPVTPLLESGQWYLRPAPLGIDASYAWATPGGDGTNVRIVDIEGAWRTNHEDMPLLFHKGGKQFADLGWRDHGTAVLGEMVGIYNEYGVTGIAHGAQAGYEGIGGQSPASAIVNAARAAGEGNIILIELQATGPDDGTACTCNPSQCNAIAEEYWQANFDAISTATANGTIVVEAAGNGSADLDSTAYRNLFSRLYRDSGAILVGASSYAGRVPMCWTNFGSRVDVHGWGESVMTMGYGDRFDAGGDESQYYTATFSGTSSASPMVTAAAACIQGALQGAGRSPLLPAAMRELLTTTGTRQAVDTRNIGPRPNLRAALLKLRL